MESLPKGRTLLSPSSSVGTWAIPEKSTPGDLTNGMPVVGAAPESGGFRKRARQDSATLPDWREGLLTRNHLMVERARQGAGAKEARLCWEKTMREVAKGWVAQPVPVATEILASIPLSQRFSIEEEHGGKDAKIRAIDDSRASQVNDLLSMEDTAVPKDLDVFFGAASMFARLGFARPANAFVMDPPPRLQARGNSDPPV